MRLRIVIQTQNFLGRYRSEKNMVIFREVLIENKIRYAREID